MPPIGEEAILRISRQSWAYLIALKAFCVGEIRSAENELSAAERHIAMSAAWEALRKVLIMQYSEEIQVVIQRAADKLVPPLPPAEIPFAKA